MNKVVYRSLTPKNLFGHSLSVMEIWASYFPPFLLRTGQFWSYFFIYGDVVYF